MTPDSLRGGAQGILTSRYILPNFSERTTNGTREYNPYGKLFEERIVFLGTEIDETAANDAMAQLLCLEFLDPDRDISIYINSPGGSFNALTAIYDTMQFVRPDIQTVCLGQANSVAAVILAAGTAGKRMVLPHSRVLLCQPDSPVRQGQISDLEIHADELDRARNWIEEVLGKHCNLDAKKVREDIERDHIMTADEAKEYGLVDQVLAPRGNSAKSAATLADGAGGSSR
ncbi:ATP-dependent Clp protease proteolytic subunit [Streptomyces noursei]|uniref:ATP-dependent Clp protease proteolytic subunit n=1 Tax=Streptomyces noursei TaxID=1971 RepID=A0A2N8P9L5_STRNR|nr:ATP-dependent Clp protease proteolytic subunit [Streptomyces noursei]PNE37724.1 Clp protease [Streptomyces noursei]